MSSHQILKSIKYVLILENQWVDTAFLKKKSNFIKIKKYLKGESLTIEGNDGWNLVLTDGYPIGWGKRSGGVLKNHYPKGLRWM